MNREELERRVLGRHQEIKIERIPPKVLKLFQQSIQDSSLNQVLENIVLPALQLFKDPTPVLKGLENPDQQITRQDILEGNVGELRLDEMSSYNEALKLSHAVKQINPQQRAAAIKTLFAEHSLQEKLINPVQYECGGPIVTKNQTTSDFSAIIQTAIKLEI